MRGFVGICEFVFVEERRGANFDGKKLRKGRSGNKLLALKQWVKFRPFNEPTKHFPNL